MNFKSLLLPFLLFTTLANANVYECQGGLSEEDSVNTLIEVVGNEITSDKPVCTFKVKSGKFFSCTKGTIIKDWVTLQNGSVKDPNQGGYYFCNDSNLEKLEPMEWHADTPQADYVLDIK